MGVAMTLLKERLKKMKNGQLTCSKCNTELSFANMGHVKDVDGLLHHEIMCKPCGDDLSQELKEGRFVENYRNNVIYCKKDKFYPYWFCMYYFDEIDDCRSFIDGRIEEMDRMRETLERWKVRD